MQYFQHCTTIEEVKKLYRQLAKDNHPDVGGNLETMQAINTEYAFACAKILKGENLSSEEINERIELSEMYRQAIEAIIHIPDIVIEIVGHWIWVSGNTFAHRSSAKGGTGILYEAGFKYANKKTDPSAWFFRTEEFKSKSYKRQSLDEIKAKYGSTSINSKFVHRAIK